MGFWEQLLGLTMLGFFAFLTYMSIKNNPQAFSSSNINHSFKTMGILALLLILAVGMMVVLLPSGEPVKIISKEQGGTLNAPSKHYRSV
jgi:ribose/xylose/arabinose/galactoside ABC-type transport system permease subunit